jgi:hypothetical protein
MYAVEKGCSFNKNKCLTIAIKKSRTSIIIYIENLLNFTNENNIDIDADDSLISLTCESCKVNKKCIAYKPCGHIFSCWFCAVKIKNCPICNKKISSLLKIFFP